MFELGSLGKALDIMKALAEEAHLIHGEVTRRREPFHDPEVSTKFNKCLEFLEEFLGL